MCEPTNSNHMKNKLLIAGLLISFISCSRVSEKRDVVTTSNVMMDMVSNAPPPPPPTILELENAKPKLIKKGNLTISTTDINRTKKSLYLLVKLCNGYVLNEKLESDNPNSYYQISLNINALYFDKFIALVDSSKFNIVAKSFSTRDVTMQYVDDATRLANKKKLEIRYLELLAKAKDVKDMVEIEEKLETLREDIESRESQMRVMEMQIAYSEFDVKIEKQVIDLGQANKNKYTYKIFQGMASGWEAITSFIVFLITIWPFYIVLAGFIYILRVWRRKNRIKKEKKAKD